MKPSELQAVKAFLKEHGYSASYDYPGYFSVQSKRLPGTVLHFGTANDSSWGWSSEDDHGYSEAGNTSYLPANFPGIQQIANWILGVCLVFDNEEVHP